MCSVRVYITVVVGVYVGECERWNLVGDILSFVCPNDCTFSVLSVISSDVVEWVLFNNTFEVS